MYFFKKSEKAEGLPLSFNVLGWYMSLKKLSKKAASSGFCRVALFPPIKSQPRITLNEKSHQQRFETGDTYRKIRLLPSEGAYAR
jgi:hypothetical protein